MTDRLAIGTTDASILGPSNVSFVIQQVLFGAMVMKMVMNQGSAWCWACLLLATLLCEPALARGGRGGARGSARGTSAAARGSIGGAARARFRPAGRSSSNAVRVASAAAAGAAVAVALTADRWYASAYRRTKSDSSEEDADDYNNNRNNTNNNYFDALRARSTQNASSLRAHVFFSIVFIATFSPALLDGVFH